MTEKMTEDSVKEGMMDLWKANFHDKEDYIKLVFDAYFRPEMVEYEERNGKIVAAMLGVPYEFGNNRQRVKGVYLCGLSTKPEYRNHGLMSALLERMAGRMKECGYSFLFLIPADKGLHKYYRDRGFVSAFYRNKWHYTSCHDFKREHRMMGCDLAYRVLSDISRLSEQEMHPMLAYIGRKEWEGAGLGILHSHEDLRVAIKECIISGGKVYYSINKENVITGVAFVSVNDGVLTIYCLHYDEKSSRYGLLDQIKSDYADVGMTIIESSFRDEATGIWRPFYGSVSPEAHDVGAVGESEKVYYPAQHSEVYGMARILDLYGILKFQAAMRPDLKYPILVKNAESDTYSMFLIEKGCVRQRAVPSLEMAEENGYITPMTETEVAEILFRRPDSDSLITEVLHLPALDGVISLMLD